jgi:hypothetical protein
MKKQSLSLNEIITKRVFINLFGVIIALRYMGVVRTTQLKVLDVGNSIYDTNGKFIPTCGADILNKYSTDGRPRWLDAKETILPSDEDNAILNKIVDVLEESKDITYEEFSRRLAQHPSTIYLSDITETIPKRVKELLSTMVDVAKRVYSPYAEALHVRNLYESDRDNSIFCFESMVCKQEIHQSIKSMWCRMLESAKILKNSDKVKECLNSDIIVPEIVLKDAVVTRSDEPSHAANPSLSKGS